MDERNRFVRGLVAWVGFRSIGVEHEREERFAGTSKAHSIGVLQLAIKAIFAHSQVPLVLIPLVGVGLFCASSCRLVALTIDWLTRGVPFPGFGTIVALMVMLFGILFCLLGIVSIYIGLIYEEVKGRPNFVVRQKLGLDDATIGPITDVLERGSSIEGSRTGKPLTADGARAPSPGARMEPAALARSGHRWRVGFHHLRLVTMVAGIPFSLLSAIIAQFREPDAEARRLHASRILGPPEWPPDPDAGHFADWMAGFVLCLLGVAPRSWRSRWPPSRLSSRSSMQESFS